MNNKAIKLVAVKHKTRYLFKCNILLVRQNQLVWVLLNFVG